MLKIQKKTDGGWIDFLTIHEDRPEFGVEYRVIADQDADSIHAMFGAAAIPGEIIVLLQQIGSECAAIEEGKISLDEDGAGPIMEDIEFGRIGSLDRNETQYLIDLAMMGHSSFMFIKSLGQL